MRFVHNWTLGEHRFRAMLRYVVSKCGEAELVLTARGLDNVMSLQNAWREAINNPPPTRMLKRDDDDGECSVLPVSIRTSPKGKCSQMTLVPLRR